MQFLKISAQKYKKEKIFLESIYILFKNVLCISLLTHNVPNKNILISTYQIISNDCKKNIITV